MGAVSPEYARSHVDAADGLLSQSECDIYPKAFVILDQQDVRKDAHLVGWVSHDCDMAMEVEPELMLCTLGIREWGTGWGKET